jgi:hypothetical protein
MAAKTARQIYAKRRQRTRTTVQLMKSDGSNPYLDSRFVLKPTGVFVAAVLCFRRKWTTFVFYGTILGALILLMVNAEPVLERLGSLESLSQMDENSDISTEAFRLGTFSERLMSFHNGLTDPRFHTLFGNPDVTKADEEHSYGETVAHDQITQTLVRYGLVGLAVYILIAATSS